MYVQCIVLFRYVGWVGGHEQKGNFLSEKVGNDGRPLTATCRFQLVIEVPLQNWLLTGNCKEICVSIENLTLRMMPFHCNMTPSGHVHVYSMYRIARIFRG